MMSQSTFARRLLEKQGWKEGDGLGKNRDGISEPIKVALKMDKTGVGHDPGSDFTNHWWLRVFNDAASSISEASEATDDIKSQTPPSKLYSGFTKGSVLADGKEEKDSDCSSEDEMTGAQGSSRLPSLDDIHKFCGGASGSRAATLGIKMNGKLSRAAEQERLFNERIMKNEAMSEEMTNIDEVEPTVKRKKKKRKDLEQTECVPETTEETISPTVTGGEKEKKKKRKKRCHLTKEIEDCDDSEKLGDRPVMNENIQIEGTDERPRKKSKKKKKHKEEEEPSVENEEVVEDVTSVKKRKKSKRSERDSEREESSQSIDMIEEPKHKKKKKHNKN